MCLLYIVILLVLVIGLYKICTRKNLRTSRILPHLVEGDKILDLGCGECCITNELNQKGYNVKGLDIVDAGTCMKPEIYNGKNIPFPDKYFDVSICAFVLHHADNYKHLLDELNRVTRRVILVFEDTPQNEWDRFFNRMHSSSEWGNCEDCFLPKKDWVDLLSKYGIVETEDISVLEFPFADSPWIYPVHKTFFACNLDGFE